MHISIHTISLCAGHNEKLSYLEKTARCGSTKRVSNGLPNFIKEYLEGQRHEREHRRAEKMLNGVFGTKGILAATTSNTF